MHHVYTEHQKINNESAIKRNPASFNEPIHYIKQWAMFIDSNTKISFYMRVPTKSNVPVDFNKPLDKSES